MFFNLILMIYSQLLRRSTAGGLVSGLVLVGHSKVGDRKSIFFYVLPLLKSRWYFPLHRPEETSMRPSPTINCAW